MNTGMKVALGVGVVVVGFLAVVATRPADFTVTRSATIGASPDVVFALVNDFHRWDAWSPWAHRDPTMKVTYSGPAAGVGAGYAWEGNGDVGAGRMTIEKTTPAREVDIALEFTKPFEGNNPTTFTLKPSGVGTEVTWTMRGHNNFVAKAFGLFMNMDTMVGGDFEKGLASMRAAAETLPKAEDAVKLVPSASAIAPATVAAAASSAVGSASAAPSSAGR